MLVVEGGVKDMADSEQIAEIRNSVRQLCANYGEDYWLALDRENGYPTEFVAELTRSGFKKAGKRHRAMLSSGAKWLLRTRHEPLWGYPLGGGGQSTGTSTAAASAAEAIHLEPVVTR